MRERILGLEFEYPLIYEPAPGETAGPTQREIHDALVLALGEGACVPSLGRKGGVFLQNGSLLHFESIDPRGRQGLLEWATPECLHPLDLVAQSASQVLRLEEACPAALARLRAAGWRGALRVLRNNEDADGNAYGCHENYLVEDPAGVGLDALRALALALHRVLLLATTTPLILLLLTLAATLLAVWAALALGRALPRVDRHALRAATALGSLRDRLLGREDSWLHRFLFRYDRLLYWPVFALHVRAARRLLLGRYARHLTRFLATRTVYTGTGRVTWAGGAAGYTLSARAGRVGDAVGVYLDTEARPVLDVKEYLAYGGLGLFQRRKRLHVLAGDSNLCQTAEFLKVGATSLVIRLIEEGALPAAPPLADPAAAFRRVAADPACASPAEPGGPRPLWSALQWQRHYLDACRARFGDLGEEETDAVLGRWDEVLGHLERSGEAPSREALRRTVDWWAKKEMLDASLAGETSWEEIAPWGRLIESLEARAKPPGPGADGWEGLLGRLDEGVRRRASESMEGPGLDPARGGWAHGVVSRLRKIDQKYHQVIPGDGYHRRLDREGLLRSEVGTEALLRAALEAPRGTRARGRSSFVRRHAGRRGAAATWGSCVLERPRGRSVLPLADPFDEAVDRAERFA